ncbi:cation:proton antiporter [Patescibacteria group bacterium]
MPIEFISFFIILFAGLFLSGIFNRLHLPWVPALIVAGIVIGPSGADLITTTEPIRFIGEIGLVFLMFMAGLETKLSKWEGIRFKVAIIATTISVASFAIGFGIAYYFQYEMMTAILLGIIFISSSVAVVIPSLTANNLLSTHVGKTIIGTALVTDVLSLLLLSVVLQTINPITELPLPIFYALLLASLIILRKMIPWVHTFLRHLSNRGDVFERESRLIFTVMLGTVILFELLGLHAIIAGFFAGFVLSDSIKSDIIKEKLHAISYGIFIPTFFIIAGASMNMEILGTAHGALAITALIIAGLLITKLLTGYISGRICKFKRRSSFLIGMALTPQLSTTLAAIFAGFEIGIVDDSLLTSVIILSIVTTIITPIAVNKISQGFYLNKVNADQQA